MPPTPSIAITLPPLHPGQLSVVNSRARFIVLDCGRRWGKTRLGALMCIAAAIRRGRAWWVAPSYPVTLVGWRVIRSLAIQIPGITINQALRLITFPGGGVVQVRSARDPDSLRGDDLDLVVIDEAAFCPEEAWTEVLRASLADRQGRALFISTPKGKNWFHRLFSNARDDSTGEWAAFQFSSMDNPFIKRSEIEAMAASIPERIYQQEILAKFLDDGGGVFRRVLEAVSATLKTARNSSADSYCYIMGIDWGEKEDFTVIIIIEWHMNDANSVPKVVFIDRFNQIDYNIQRARVMAAYEAFRPFIVVAESNNIGEPNIEQLQLDGIPVTPFSTTDVSKLKLVEQLALAFERRRIRIPHDLELIDELQSYESERLPSGYL